MREFWTAILLSCFVAQLMANPPEEYLIFTEDTKISRMNLDGQKHETILESLTSPTGMAVDLVSGVIFYTDADDRSISRSNLDGSDARTIMSIEGSPFGVAVDPEQLTVYWSDKENARIEKCNYVGEDRTVVVDGLEQPMGIALDLINRKVYWADINAAFIGRANMDGSDQERQLAVSEGTTAAPSGWPETLVLDEDGTLFWSDVLTRKIYRRTVDGVCTVVVAGPSQVKGMAIHDGYIYYSELFEMKISRVPTTGGIPEVIKDNLLFPRGIVIARATDALPAPTTAVPIGTQDPPVLEMIRDAQGAVTFQCTVPAVTNVEQFLVTWKSNSGATIVRTELVNAGVLNLVLAESDHNVIQGTLACIVQTRVVRRDEELGPEVSSNVFTATQEVSPSRLEMTEGDESQDITVRFNAPPVFYEGNEGFFLRPELQEADDEITDVDGQVIEQLVFEAQPGTLSSEILVTNTNWDQVHTFKVKAKLDGMVDRTKTRVVQIYRQSATGRLRRKRDNGSRTLVGETETIVVNGDTNAECEVEGEPRITTFDGRVYDNHMEGEFILFKHKLRAAQVNVVFQSCGAGSCVCAVLIKALNNVYAFDKCRRQGQRGDGHLRRYRIGRQERYSRVRIISEDFGWRHKVLLPGSREVTISGRGWRSIFTPVLFKPSSDRLDFMQTQGLCGYYDKDVVNDLMFFDGTVQSEPLPQPSDNVQFNHEYSCLKRADFSLLNGVLDDSHEEIPVVYCRSGEQGEECEEDLDSLVNDAKYDITDDIPVVAPDGGNQGRRRKRSVASSLDFDPFAPIVYDPNHKVGQVVWPTAGGRTLQEVQDHCRNKLMSHTGVQLCATVLNVTFEKDINGCVQDIGMTDELAWADRSVSAVIERCISFVNRQDNSAPKGAPKPLLPGGVNRTELMSKVCPSGCSQQGACAEGKCTCFEGFTGSDCSMRLTDPPELTTLGETFCDVTTQKCDVIVVFGWKFHHRESLTCHLQEYELGQPLPASRPLTVKARFRKFDEIVCSVPTSHANMGYIVRVSNDGVTMTTGSRLFRKYDSRCHDCYMEGEDITKATCEIQPFTCVIGGHCYDARQTNPLNRCLVCQPDGSTAEWTVNRADDTCQTTPNQETEDLILIIGSVVGVIIGITVLVGVVAICISQRKFFKNEMANAKSQPNAPRRLSQTITPMARDNPIYTLETDVNGIREQVPTNGGGKVEKSGVVVGDPPRRPSLAWSP